MKLVICLILLASLLEVNKAEIVVKAIPESSLKDFMLYQASMLISPFKSEEELTPPPIENYLPVKIKLINNPEIIIKESANERRLRETRRQRRLLQRRSRALV